MEFSFQETADYLTITATGPWTTSEMPWQIERIKDEAESRNYRLLLIDLLNIDYPENETTRFISGENVAKLLPPPFRIAVLSTPEKINRFGENVAVNRGAVMTVFSDKTTALNWLLEPADQ